MRYYCIKQHDITDYGMENRSLLIALVIGFVCLWLEQVTREKKESLYKFVSWGLSISIIGIVIVPISSFFT